MATWLAVCIDTVSLILTLTLSLTLKPNLTLNPKPKLTSGVAGGLFPRAVFTPTPIPSLAKVPI